MNSLLTTTEAAALLSDRGITVRSKRDGTDRPPSANTVKHWCQQGRFATAQRIGGTQRGYWLIDKAELLAFTPPAIGPAESP